MADTERELIVLASPPDIDDYYEDVSKEIFDFHVAYAKAILPYDDVLIFTNETYYSDYVGEIGKGHVLKYPMEDIWMRDFALSNSSAPVMFRYSAEGQGGGRKGQRDADAVQNRFARLMVKAGVDFTESDWLNDGGNFVDDYDGRAILSRKFLRDNKLSEEDGRAAIRNATDAEHVAFIEADEQGGLEHADGVAAFIEPNVVVINSYPEDVPYADELKANLRAGLPDVTIHEITTPYDGSDIYDSRFGSACGLYTNMLVTPRRIFFPQFGIPEDKLALAQMGDWTDKEIIPIQSSGVCHMGGGVRCMSWQLRGKNARALLGYVAAQNGG
ncbi:MAG: agmatine deiminase family protein [Maricaulaceae bacterium]